MPLLGQIPLEPAVAAGGDAGEPVALGDGPAAEAFRAIADRIVTEAIPPIDMSGCSARLPDDPDGPQPVTLKPRRPKR